MPRLGVAFDIGRCPYSMIEIPKLFITHGHLDHVSGIVYHASQRSLRNLSPSEFYVPQAMVEPLQEIMNAWSRIEDYRIPFSITPVREGDLIPLSGNLNIKAIPSYHRVPSFGYLIYESVQKLRKEYLSLSGKEIVKLKESRDDLFETKETSHVAFSGDTRIEFVMQHPQVQSTKVLFLECTYIDHHRPVERAREWGHTHLDEIAANHHLFDKVERLVLIHLSPRYSRDYILSMMKKKLPRSLWEKSTIFQQKTDIS